MSINEHFNHDFDGGSPDLPQAVGDRFYSADLSQEHSYMLDKIGDSIKDIGKEIPVIISGLEVSKGSGNTLNISAGVGYAEYNITLINPAWTVPPGTKSGTIGARKITGAIQTNLAIPSAVLNDVAVNYIKLKYKDIAVDTRQKAKAAATYTYLQEDSYEFIVDTTAPTNQEILLATFVSVGNNVPEIFDISDRTIKYYPNQKTNIIAKETINKNDPVMLNALGAYKTEYGNNGESAFFTGNAPLFNASTQIEDNRFVTTYIDNVSGLHARVGEYVNGAIVWLTSAITVGATLANRCKITKLSNNRFIIAWTNNVAGTYTLRVRVGEYSSSTITWLTAVTTITTTAISAVGSLVCDIASLEENDKFVIGYRATSFGRIQVAQYSGGGITILAGETTIGVDINGISVCKINTDTFAIGYNYFSNGYTYIRTAVYSAGAITFDTAYNVNNSSGVSIVRPLPKNNYYACYYRTSTGTMGFRIFKRFFENISSTWIAQRITKLLTLRGTCSTTSNNTPLGMVIHANNIITLVNHQARSGTDTLHITSVVLDKGKIIIRNSYDESFIGSSDRLDATPLANGLALVTVKDANATDGKVKVIKEPFFTGINCQNLTNGQSGSVVVDGIVEIEGLEPGQDYAIDSDGTLDIDVAIGREDYDSEVGDGINAEASNYMIPVGKAISSSELKIK